MAHGITLTLKQITNYPKIMSPQEYKQKYCWPDGGCVTGVSDRATRRNRKFARRQFSHLEKLK